MKKKEIIWRYILNEALKKRQFIFTQKNLAAMFHVSTCTVFNAIKAPRQLGAIEVTGRFFRLKNIEKLLLLWATHRNFSSDIIYTASVEKSAREIEGFMPPDVIFGAFSAYRFTYNSAPADYDQVYVYANEIDEIKKRFPLRKKGQENLFVLKADPYLHSFGSVTPDVQTFVDLWNIGIWYAKDYLNALKEKIL